MKKEIVKFTKGIYCIHDELLFSLYEMIPNHVTEKIVNGENYLVVERYFSRNNGLSLIAKIPDELLLENGQHYNYDDIGEYKQEDIREQLKEKLSFTVQEIYLFNILLDNYLRGNDQLKMSDLHSFYRDKKFEKNRTIDRVTIVCYLKALISLAKKEIYCITSDNFRQPTYGVNNKEFYGKLLTIFDFIPRENNGDFTIKYSLGELGNILKKSKRYSSDILPNKVFAYKFRSAKKYMITMQLARTIFIKRLNSKSYYPYSGFELNVIDLIADIPAFDKKGNNKGVTMLENIYDSKYQYKVAQMTKVVDYIEKALTLFQKYQVISDYDIETDKRCISVSEFEKLKIRIALQGY